MNFSNFAVFFILGFLALVCSSIAQSHQGHQQPQEGDHYGGGPLGGGGGHHQQPQEGERYDAGGPLGQQQSQEGESYGPGDDRDLASTLGVDREALYEELLRLQEEMGAADEAAPPPEEMDQQDVSEY